MGIGRSPGGSLGKWSSQITGVSPDSTNIWTEAQTFSTGVILNPDAVFILPTSSSVPSISSSGQAIWDSTHEALIIANGSSGRHFIPSEGIAGQGSMDTAGALTINADHSGSSHINLTEAHSWSAQQTFTTGINLTAGQLIFPATQIASADANTLDDYEEGTFTPSIGDDNADGTGEGQAYSVQTGSYTKIGNRVYFEAYVVISDLGTLTTTQAVTVPGLPFTSNNTVNTQASCSVGSGESLALPNASESIVVTVGVNSDIFSPVVWDGTIGTSPLLVSELSVGGGIRVSGVYRV